MIDEQALTKEMAVWFRELIYVRVTFPGGPASLPRRPPFPGKRRGLWEARRPWRASAQHSKPFSLMHVSRQRNLSASRPAHPLTSESEFCFLVCG